MSNPSLSGPRKYMANTTKCIPIEVVYALPDMQVLKKLDVPQGSNLMQAIELSGIIEQFSEIDPKQGKFGIFGKLATPTTLLQPHDRVEIYRSLIIDPKDARRLRARTRQSHL